jgi:predicted RNase H-like HicB family nuclease
MPTSAKSKSSSAKIDRPFDPATLRRAREIVTGYQIILHAEDRLYFGRGLELPTAMNHGKTPDECVKATRDILATAVAYMLEQGKRHPRPRRKSSVQSRSTCG